MLCRPDANGADRRARNAATGALSNGYPSPAQESPASGHRDVRRRWGRDGSPEQGRVANGSLITPRICHIVFRRPWCSWRGAASVSPVTSFSTSTPTWSAASTVASAALRRRATAPGPRPKAAPSPEPHPRATARTTSSLTRDRTCRPRPVGRRPRRAPRRSRNPLLRRSETVSGRAGEPRRRRTGSLNHVVFGKTEVRQH